MIPVRKSYITRALWALAGVSLLLAGCVRVPQNSLSVYQRSMVVETRNTETAILEKARLEVLEGPWSRPVKVLHLRGTPYEMGFQHGKLLAEDIRTCVNHVIGQVRRFASEDAMDEAYDLMAHYIPLEEKEEMRGLAHGAGVPLRVIHWFHAIPEVSEYRYKKRFSWRYKQTSCSNLIAFGKATADGRPYQLRVLDWNRELGVQRWPVILVHAPDRGNASVTLSYAGFIGCVSGMNDQRMAFGEMGYGNPEGETLEGIPFVFLFRKMMREASTLSQATDILKAATRTCSYVFAISDAKARDRDKALLFVVDRERVRIFGENAELVDERDGERFPAVEHVVYAGARPMVLHREIVRHYGKISPAVLMEIPKSVSLSGNMQNVVFAPGTLSIWVSNASNATRDEAGKASNQPYLHFSFRKALGLKAVGRQVSY